MKMPQLTIRFTLLMIIGFLNTLIAVLIGNNVYESWIDYKHVQDLKHGSAVINALFDANQNLSLERATSLSVLYASPAEIADLKDDLIKSRKQADRAFEHALNGIGSRVSPSSASLLSSIRAGRTRLNTLRKDLDTTLQKPFNQRDLLLSEGIFSTTTDLILQIQNFILIYARPLQGLDAAVMQQMRFKYFVWELAEHTGEEYATIGKLLAEEKWPTSTQREFLMSLSERARYGWAIIRQFALNDELAEKLLPLMEEAETHYAFTFDQIHDLFFGFEPIPESASYPLTSSMWLGMASQAVDSLLALQDEVLKETRKHVDTIEHTAKQKILLNLVILLFALGLSVYCWSIIVFRVTRPVNATVNALFKATQNETFEMPKIHHPHDEIGKLLHVLEVFQENAAQMKQSNEELERFAYIAAHDLKSPLRAVDNLSQWLEEDLQSVLQDTDKEHMQELRKRVRLMEKLLDDTLEYARIGSKQDPTSTATINGAAMIDEIKGLLSVPEHFTVVAGPTLSNANIPKSSLQQVLHNLISNAIKHHDRHDGKIEIDLNQNENEYAFTVTDDGPGIEPQYHQKIFEMFQTLSHDKSKGRGMGLAMVRRIVHEHGGKISVQSTPGKGSVFRFTWLKNDIPSTTNEDKNNARLYG